MPDVALVARNRHSSGASVRILDVKEKSMSYQLPKLIQCGDQSFAPWAVVCIHICNGTATDVVAIPQPEGSELEADWLCSDCEMQFRTTASLNISDRTAAE
jgi:hypothetical protein